MNAFLTSCFKRPDAVVGGIKTNFVERIDSASPFDSSSNVVTTVRSSFLYNSFWLTIDVINVSIAPPCVAGTGSSPGAIRQILFIVIFISYTGS